MLERGDYGVFGGDGGEAVKAKLREGVDGSIDASVSVEAIDFFDFLEVYRWFLVFEMI